MNKNITIEVVTGGFLLSYTVEKANAAVGLTVNSSYDYEREVFTSQSKLTKRVKELLDGYAGDTGEVKDAE